MRTTTVESQKGNGEVTSTSSDAVVGTRIEPLSCTYKSVQIVYSGGIFGGSPQTVVNYYPYPLSDCAVRGLFLTP